MTRALALELAPWHITANGISPGPFATEMNRAIIDDPEKNAQFLARIPPAAGARWKRSAGWPSISVRKKPVSLPAPISSSTAAG